MMFWRIVRAVVLLAATAAITMAVLWAITALADDEAYMHTHDGDVGQFYMSWNRPDLYGLGQRNGSCCGKADCRPVHAMRKVGAGGHYMSIEVEILNPGTRKFQWYPVPDRLWEDQQPDPRESPDERSHVCINNGQVICAVRVSGQ